MNSFIFYLMNVFLIVPETVLAVIVGDTFFRRKHSGRRFFLLSVLLFLVHTLLLWIFGSFALLKLLPIVLLFCIWYKCSFRAGYAQSVFVSVLLISYLTIVDTLFLTSVQFFKNGSELLQNPYAYYLICYTMKIFELLSVVVVQMLIKGRHAKSSATSADTLRVLFFPAATLLIAFFLYSILLQDAAHAPTLLLCTAILLLADMMSIFLLNHLERQQTALLENTVLRQNLKLETDHIHSLEEAYSKQRTQTHEFNNHLAVLRSMADRQVPLTEFRQYLDTIVNTAPALSAHINTRRLVVDIVVSQKLTAMEKKGIDFRISLEDLSDFPLPDDCIVVVLTNLLDNAIEACEKLPPDREKYVLLKMTVSPEVSYLYVENPTAAPVVIRDNRIRTTKTDPLAHGFGLKNIASILEEHDGFYAVEYRPETGTFCFTAQI